MWVFTLRLLVTVTLCHGVGTIILDLFLDTDFLFKMGIHVNQVVQPTAFAQSDGLL